MTELRRDVEVRLVPGPIDPGAEPAPPLDGAECRFVGRTRPEHHAKHGDLLALDYDCYEPMARRILEVIGMDIIARHGCRFVRLLHATGPVAVGEASVLVQVVASHRDEAFTACREGIDSLKRRVPIWKRQRWTGGTTWAAGRPRSSSTDDRSDPPRTAPLGPGRRLARARSGGD